MALTGHGLWRRVGVLRRAFGRIGEQGRVGAQAIELRRDVARVVVLRRGDERVFELRREDERVGVLRRDVERVLSCAGKTSGLLSLWVPTIAAVLRAGAVPGCVLRA